MAFRIWFYFLVLTGFMLLLMWMLQIAFIGPYYEKNRATTTELKAEEIARLLQQENTDNTQIDFAKLLSAENMCGSVFNNEGKEIMSANTKISNCHMSTLSQSAINEYILMVKDSKMDVFTLRFTSEIFEQGLYFLGKEVVVNEESLFIFLNSPIELLDSTIFVLRRQFGFLAASVFSIATFVAFVLSKRLSQPISEITKNARRLAEGDYSVHFDSGGYNEITALSQTLNYATSEFKKTDELRRDLVANVSHDIKTPLTMIKAYAEMVVDISGDHKEQREEHLRVIIDEANHLERLVNDMLTLSRYESKVYNINESIFNLYDHVVSTANLFKMLDVEFEIDVDQSIEVSADEIKMGQVLYNYINNASRFVGMDQKIIIHAVRLNHQDILVSVRDHGPGIAPEVLDTMWDRYVKIDKNFQRTSSTGLGLSIVRAICEATGSSYGVDTKVNEGTSFYYTLKEYKSR